ncbi:MAG TPA: hypothetical protein VFA00_05975 [Actinomycetota bacterium]|jgi:hypothetical protein|nr:hypothetical protein [Actinomycetota bacterium]
MTDQHATYAEKAEQLLKDLDLEIGDTQTRQVKAAEAQAWASLAMVEAMTDAAQSLHGDLSQILKVFPKSLGAK